MSNLGAYGDYFRGLMSKTWEQQEYAARDAMFSGFSAERLEFRVIVGRLDLWTLAYQRCGVRTELWKNGPPGQMPVCLYPGATPQTV